MVSFRTHTDHFEPKQISSNSKPNTINELLYAIYARCTRAVRIRVFIILNGFIFMHCNCIYDKWPWCVLVKRYTCILIYSTAHGYLIIDSLNEFFNLGERKFCKKKILLKKHSSWRILLPIQKSGKWRMKQPSPL